MVHQTTINLKASPLLPRKKSGKMKNLFFALIALVSFTVFTGCNKDDDDMGDEVKNEFTYDGTTYALTKGFLNDVGGNLNGSHDWDVFLVSSGVDKNGFSLTGTGEIIYLDLNTDTSTGLVAGTYNWANQRDPFTIVPGSEVFLDYNLDTFTGTKVAFTAGTADVAIDGTETTITFTVTADGKTLSGEWKGTLEDI